MINRSTLVLVSLSIAAACSSAVHRLNAADDGKQAPPAPPASQFAPADDALAQVDYYIKRVGDTLTNKEQFDDTAKSKIKKDGNTIAILGMVLGLHDQDNRIKPRAGDLVQAGQALAKATNFDAASAAFEDIKKAASGEGTASNPAPTQWGKVASLGQIMKQVTAINAALKRGVTTPKRLEQLKAESSGHAAMMAAIAQASMYDTHEVKNPADLDKWYEYCAEMRDAAGQVNAAVRAGDHPKTTAAMSRLAHSCEACHKVFRKEDH
jgi:hypothetical protein